MQSADPQSVLNLNNLNNSQDNWEQVNSRHSNKNKKDTKTLYNTHNYNINQSQQRQQYVQSSQQRQHSTLNNTLHNSVQPSQQHNQQHNHQRSYTPNIQHTQVQQNIQQQNIQQQNIQHTQVQPNLQVQPNIQQNIQVQPNIQHHQKSQNHSQNPNAKHQIIQLSIDAKGYFTTPKIIQEYQNKPGPQVIIDLNKFIEEQSISTSYISYQPPNNPRPNLSQLYSKQKQSMFIMLVYNFIGLGNPDITSIIELIKSYNNSWAKNIQNQDSLVTNYNFLNKLTWLPETTSQETFNSMFDILVSNGVNPFEKNNHEEDSFGALFSNNAITSSTKNARCDVMLLKTTENIAEVTIRAIINRGINNWDKNMQLFKYLYSLHPSVYSTIIVENLSKFIDLPKPMLCYTGLTLLINLSLTIFKRDQSIKTSFSQVEDYYNLINSKLTVLKNERYRIKTNNREKHLLPIINAKIAEMKLCWDGNLANYYFNKYGNIKYLDTISSLKLLLNKIFANIEVTCEKFYNKEINETRASWSLECLVAGACEIFKSGEKYNTIVDYILNVFEDFNKEIIINQTHENCFVKLPLNIKVKIAIRTLVHCYNNSLDSKILDIFTKIKEIKTLDKPILFLIDDFLKKYGTRVNINIKETKEIKEEPKIKIQFKGLDLKNALNKTFNAWTEDVIYNVELYVKNITREKISEQLIKDICLCPDSSKVSTNSHFKELLNSSNLLKILNKTMLQEQLTKFYKITQEEECDLIVDAPWVNMSVELLKEILK
jgi:hypothetical protein